MSNPEIAKLLFFIAMCVAGDGIGIYAVWHWDVKPAMRFLGVVIIVLSSFAIGVVATLIMVSP